MDTNEPLPYYAGLAKVLHGPTLALVLTYLEFHHPPPQDPSKPPSSPSNASSAPAVVIDCDVVSAALGVSRRTLHIAFSCLGCWWSSEEDQARAARAGREFLNPNHSLKPTGHDPVKCYSFTGFKAYTLPHRKLAIRRNFSKLRSVLVLAHILSCTHTQTPLNEIVEGRAPSRSLHSLPDILHSVLPNWSDRRAERWERWRRENGGRKSQNPGRMAGNDKRKIVVSSSDARVSDYDI